MKDLDSLKAERKKIKDKICMKSKAIYRIRELASKWSVEISEMRTLHNALDRKIFVEEVGITIVNPKDVKRQYEKKPTLSLEEQVDNMSAKELRELITSLERKKSMFDGQTKVINGD